MAYFLGKKYLAGTKENILHFSRHFAQRVCCAMQYRAINTTMKTIFIAASLFFVVVCGSAQTPAVTENGDEVLLYNDGTWKYIKQPENRELATNPQPFTKNDDATFQVKSKKVPISIWINPKKWSFQKSGPNDASEYEFELKGEDAHGLLIAEKIAIPLQNLKDIAFENAKEVSPDIEIVHQEYRNVNGVTVLCMQMDGTIHGTRFTYYGYYFTSELGTIQFLTYTSQNLFPTYREQMETLLNGILLAQ